MTKRTTQARRRDRVSALGEATTEVGRHLGPNPSSLRALRASVACFVFCAACGYAPVRGQKARALRVAAVKNATAQAEAGGLFAAAVRSELAGRGQLDPDGAASPELVLEVLSLRSVPGGSAGEGAASFRVDAEIKVKVGTWEDRVRSSEDYFSGIDVLGTEANRRAALRRVARTAAREAIDRYDVFERLKQ